MKITSKDGKTWFEKKPTSVEVGFTKEFLAELDTCWHMLPAAVRQTPIKEGQPLCSIETNDGLFSVPSPVSGIIAFFDNRAMNFPDKLTEETILCSLAEKAVPETAQQQEINQFLAELGAIEAPRAAQPRIRPAIRPAQGAAGIAQVAPVGNWAAQPLRFFDDAQEGN